nr:hypothetical protein [Anaerolineales bacterium]
MNATEPQNGNTRDVINAVSIYFTDRKDLFPAGAWFAFHRRRGEETRVCFRDGSPTSWAALMHLINTSPGRLTVDSNGLGWWPRRPDRCRLDTERLRQAIRDLLEEGEWLFDEEEIGWAQRYDF